MHVLVRVFFLVMVLLTSGARLQSTVSFRACLLPFVLYEDLDTTFHKMNYNLVAGVELPLNVTVNRVSKGSCIFVCCLFICMHCFFLLLMSSVMIRFIIAFGARKFSSLFW
jgi:hypothetical protein